MLLAIIKSDYGKLSTIEQLLNEDNLEGQPEFVY